MNQYQLPIDSIKTGTRILLPESRDIRVIMAAVTLKLAGIIDPVLIGDRSEIESIFTDAYIRNKYSLTDVTDAERDALMHIDILPLDLPISEGYAELHASKKSISTEDARAHFPSDISQAAHILKTGGVDGVVCGSIASTADVIRVGYNILGLAPDSRISGEFLMTPGRASLRDETYVIADCAVNPTPTAEQLVGIAASAVETHRSFFPDIAPRVAFLSFSTHQSGVGASVDMVRDAYTQFTQKYPDIEADGPLQLDAAVKRSVYEQKVGANGALTAPANILIFPTLDAGNTAYKMLEIYGGYNAIGPILTGFSHPGWSDLSRGTSIQTIVDMAYVTALRTMRR